MKIFSAMKNPKYLALAAVSSVLFALFYIYTQVLFIVENIDLWIGVTPWYNMTLFIILAALFGTTLSFQVYSRTQPKTCRTDKKSVGASSSATVLSFFVAQCPACASLGALLLPSAVFVSVFVQLNSLFTLISIGLMLFTINYLGGFRK